MAHHLHMISHYNYPGDCCAVTSFYTLEQNNLLLAFQASSHWHCLQEHKCESGFILFHWEYKEL